MEKAKPQPEIEPSSRAFAGLRRQWSSPQVLRLPRLSELTLQSPNIPCEGDGAPGSTVCP